LKTVIEKRNIEDFELKAKLHGRQYNSPMKPLGITPEKRDEYNEQANALLDRMKKKHKETQLDG